MPIKPEKIEITTSTVLKVLGIIIALVLAWYLRSVLVLLFIVLIVAASLSPFVDWAEKRRIPRLLSVIIIYILFLAMLFLLGYLIFPPLVHQIIDFANTAPQYVKYPEFFSAGKLQSFVETYNISGTISENISTILSNTASIAQGIFTASATAFTALAQLIIALALIFYILLTKNQLIEGILKYIPKRKKKLFYKVGGEILLKLGMWSRGQFALCLLVGLIDGIALKIIGVPFALALGVFAGFTELMPNVGPIIGAIPAIIIAYFVSPVKALIVAIVYIAVQQLENHVLVPNIMRQAVGINPAVIIIAVLIGAELYGILGIIIAVPIASILAIIIRTWREQIIEAQNLNR